MNDPLDRRRRRRTAPCQLGAVLGVIVGAGLTALVTWLVPAPPGEQPYWFIGWWIMFFGLTILGGWIGRMLGKEVDYRKFKRKKAERNS